MQSHQRLSSLPLPRTLSSAPAGALTSIQRITAALRWKQVAAPLSIVGAPGPADLDAVREQLAGRGVGVSEIQQLGPEGTPGSRFVFFDDPDGNTWTLQQLPDYSATAGQPST